MLRWTSALLMGGCLAAQQVPEAPSEGGARLLELLNTPIAVTSHVPLSNRESPGITTVLQREEIMASGARDLMDVLRFVPGFAFASDTNGVVGIGVRTCWGHDGKVLLLIDGQEMVEPLYGTLQFGGHYPIDNVQRIEIIRGPGSVLYGGFAELAVINVITRKGGNIGGVDGSFWLGQMASAQHNLAKGHVAYGQVFGDLDVALSYVRGQAPQGVGSWQKPAYAGSTVIQAGDASATHQDFLNLKASYGNLNLHYLRDDYAVNDYTGEFKTTTTPIRFPGEFFGVNDLFEVGAWSFKPSLTIKSQAPWLYTAARTDRNTRTDGGLLATWAATKTFKVTLGADVIQDNTNMFWSSRNVRETYVYESRATYLQMLWSKDFGNLDLGVRYDYNNAFGSALSPRLAFTKATETWHVKLLAAGAFQAPSYEDLFANPSLRPERTRTFEVEYGHAVGPTSYLTANAFYLRVHDPISYGNPAPGVNGYYNFNYTGAHGLEVTLRSLWTDLVLQAAVSLSRADDQNAAFYAVLGQPSYHVGFANLKVSSQAQWQFAQDWSLNPECLLLGPRYGYRLGEVAPSRFGSTVLLNLFLTRRLSSHAELGLSLRNLANATMDYIQAFGIPGAGGNPPLPGPGREIALRASFTY